MKSKLIRLISIGLIVILAVSIGWFVRVTLENNFGIILDPIFFTLLTFLVGLPAGVVIGRILWRRRE